MFIFVTQKFCCHLLAHHLYLITHFLTHGTYFFRLISRWLLLLAKFDITCVILKAIKSQTLANLLACFPSKEYESHLETLPRKFIEVASITNALKEWWLSSNGSSTTKREGVGVTLTNLDGSTFFVFQVDFQIF